MYSILLIQGAQEWGLVISNDRKDYFKEYQKRPEVKERRREMLKRPNVKDKVLHQQRVRRKRHKRSFKIFLLVILDQLDQICGDITYED